MFEPNRENDELTRALGNPEHPGRTQGKGVIPWYEGFSEWNDDYRTRARKKMEEEKKRKLEEEQRKQGAERLQGLEARHADLHSNSSNSSSRSTHLARKGGLSSGSSKRMIVQHWIAPSHPCREAALVPPRATHCWIDTLWMTSWRALTMSYTSK